MVALRGGSSWAVLVVVRRTREAGERRAEVTRVCAATGAHPNARPDGLMIPAAAASRHAGAELRGACDDGSMTAVRARIRPIPRAFPLAFLAATGGWVVSTGPVLA